MTATTLQFDPPGPIGRRRTRAATVISIVCILAVCVVGAWQLARNGQFAAYQWDALGQWPNIRFLLIGLGNTMIAGLISAAIAMPIGALAALGRISHHAVLSRAIGLLVEFFRAVPLLLLIFFFLLVLPGIGIRIPLLWQLVLPLVIYNSAVLAEIFRAGFLAIPKGQTEAGLAIGLTSGQVMRMIVMPQAFRVLLPQLIVRFIRIIKDTTLGYVVSFPELLQSGKVLAAFTNHLLPTYVVVAAMYAVMNILLAWVASLVERRVAQSKGSKTTQTASPALAEANLDISGA